MPHYHYSIGLPGYTPNVNEAFRDILELSDALSGELMRSSEYEYETAQALAEAEDYEQAWRTLKRSEELELLSRNFSNNRMAAPLYVNDEPLWRMTVQRMIGDTFPLMVSENEQMSVWSDCGYADCFDEQDN